MVNKDLVITEAKSVFDYLVFNTDNEFDILSKNQVNPIKECIKKDLNFFYESDPAANSIDEIRLAYPGFIAITYYRIAHILYEENKKIEARIISEYAHFLTGIDINAGASIGCPFFIDHGTGVVIGETSIIKDYVRIYQGVTLGALSPNKGQLIKGIKRHPTINDNVTIYAGASILGDIEIGKNCTIGGGVFILESIKENTLVKNPKPILEYSPIKKK